MGRCCFTLPRTRVDQIIIPSALEQGLSGAVFTHNHPGGHSISERDLEFAMMSGLSEIRAVTSHARYSLRPPARGWGYMARLALRRIVERKKELLVRDLRQQIARGQLAEDVAELEFEHRLWIRVAATGLLRYAADPWTGE
jgi:hypothetical protein